ncbi:MAG: hypothetical protein CMG60_09045 [Candidatus Marinimicrobia bacterium]|nr:hypothetical protein [Candidatus Neomarinimicrobiota bacterium]
MKPPFYSFLIITCLFANNFDSQDGSPIRQGVHIEWYRTVSPGNAGEVIFTWSDTRFGMRNIFSHKVNQEGEMVWGDNGAIVTNLPGRQEDPVSITDGSGGVYIAWVDYRFDEEGDIFLQHLDNYGNRLLDDNGVALAQVNGKQITINMCTDSLGGAFITWQDKRGGIDEDIYGTHISSNHELIAPGVGVPIVVQGGNQNAKTIEYAGNNEAFIAWADFRDGANADIYSQRIDVAMSAIYIDNGIQITTSQEQDLNPRATFVNNNISFVSWKQGDENSKIYYQFVDSDGLVFSEPKPVSSNSAIQTAPRVKRNSIGDVFLNWKDLRDDPINGDQYFQKINFNGDAEWGDGIRLDPVEAVDFSTRFSPGNNGDVSVVWERGVFPDVNIIFQNINSDGTYSLELPIVLSNTEGYQFAPIINGDISNGLYSIYGDKSSGSIDLKIQKINPDFFPEWPDNGLTAMTGLDGDVNYSRSYRISDQDFYLIWEDNRSSKKIFGTRITNLDSQFENGFQLSYGDNSSSETDFSLPKFTRNDDYLYLATFDGSAAPKFIRINKLDDQLNNIWDSSGVSLAPVFDMRKAELVTINNGVGCFWSESRGFNYDIYYQRLDGNGEATLEVNGKEIIDSNGDDYIMGVIPTPSSQYMIFWLEDAWPAAKLMYSMVDQDGNIAIGWNPNGNSLSDPSFNSRHLQIKEISDNGILAVWVQDGNFSDIYAQMIDWQGNILWQSGGIVITDADNDQGNMSFGFNDSGTRSLIAWEDYRNGSDFEIFGQVIDLENGVLEGEIILFSSDTTDQYNPSVVSIQDNEFFIIWEDERGYYNNDPLLINGVDLYGSGYVIEQGMTTEPNGIPICIAYHKQQNVNVTRHVGDEFFLDWIDYRSSGKEDLANYYGKTLMKAELLFTNEISRGADIPSEFHLMAVYPNPFNGTVYFDYNILAKQEINFKVYDLNGRLVFSSLIIPSFGGKQRISWSGRDHNGNNLSSGLYLYQLSTSANMEVGKVTYLK